jgi:putative transposase
MQSWRARPLDEVYTVVCTDANMVKTRVARVAGRPVYAAIGATLTGEKDVLGLWPGGAGKASSSG